MAWKPAPPDTHEPSEPDPEPSRPAPIDKAIDALAKLRTRNGRVLRAWDQWDRRRGQRVGPAPDDVYSVLPESVTDDNARAAHGKARREAYPDVPGSWHRFYDATDELTLEARRCRVAIANASASLSSVQSWMDRNRHRTFALSTEETIGILNALGTLISVNRLGDTPTGLDREAFERVALSLDAPLAKLKAIVGDDFDESNPPAIALLHALNGLSGLCKTGMFRELAENRKRASDTHTNLLTLRGKIACDRANELARAGAPMDEQWAALSEGMDGPNDPPPPNEPAEYTKALRTLLDHGRTWCDRARKAVRAEGATGLDAATQPNTAGQPRSVEVGVKLLAAERVFDGLSLHVASPSGYMDDDVASMADLGEWFARTRDELRVVIETRRTVVDPAGAKSASPRNGRSHQKSGKRSKADRVRDLLTGPTPYVGTKSELAAKVGYTHPASLAHVKKFDYLWAENERNLARERAEREKKLRSLDR